MTIDRLADIVRRQEAKGFEHAILVRKPFAREPRSTCYILPGLRGRYLGGFPGRDVAVEVLVADIRKWLARRGITP